MVRRRVDEYLGVTITPLPHRATMFRRKDAEEQSSFWIATSDLPSTPANTFYRRLDRALAESSFSDAIRALCEPFYESDRSRGGRPGIDPEVHFKMQMVGTLQRLPGTEDPPSLGA